MGNAAYNIALCVDCVYVEANGHDDNVDATWTGFYDVWDRYAFAPVVDEHLGEPKEPHFSWSQCDGCGSPLGGDRFDYVAVEVHA